MRAQSFGTLVLCHAFPLLQIVGDSSTCPISSLAKPSFSWKLNSVFDLVSPASLTRRDATAVCSYISCHTSCEPLVARIPKRKEGRVRSRRVGSRLAKGCAVNFQVALLQPSFIISGDLVGGGGLLLLGTSVISCLTYVPEERGNQRSGTTNKIRDCIHFQNPHIVNHLTNTLDSENKIFRQMDLHTV